jgi:hypothetical protein
VVTAGDAVVGNLYVDIAEPELKYIVVQQNGGPLLCLPPDTAAPLSPDLLLRLVDIRTNLPEEAAVKAYLSRGGSQRQPFPVNRPIRLRERLAGADRIELMHNRLLIGSVPLAPAAAENSATAPHKPRVSAGQLPSAPNRSRNDS